MPWYVADYLVDTTNLNTEQHGAYCLMLMAAWKNGGGLPKDDRQLAAITKLSPAKWRAHKEILIAFFKDDGNCYVHDRVAREHAKAKSISEKKAKVGADGASKRWQKGGESHPDEMAIAMANAMANGIANGMAEGMANESQTAWQIDAPSQLTVNSKEDSSKGSSKETTCSPEIARIGDLCSRLRRIGINASPGAFAEPKWAPILAHFDNDAIVKLGQQKRDARPDQVLYAAYLIGPLTDLINSPPDQSTGEPHAASQQPSRNDCNAAVLREAQHGFEDGGDVIEGEARVVG